MKFPNYVQGTIILQSTLRENLEFPERAEGYLFMTFAAVVIGHLVDLHVVVCGVKDAPSICHSATELSNMNETKPDNWS